MEEEVTAVNEIAEAKKKLYYLLLGKLKSELTESEACIGYYLVKDRDIQDMLDRALFGRNGAAIKKQNGR